MRAEPIPPSVAWEEITPEIAAKWLAVPTTNRKTKPGAAERLAAAMVRGEWDPYNGETIKLASDGAVLDGKHRLSAVVISGVTITALVVRDVSPAAHHTIDVGAKRSLADSLTLRGQVEAAAMASAITVLFRYESGLMMRRSQTATPTIPQALAIYEAEREGLEEARSAARQVRSCLRYPPGTCIALQHLFSVAWEDGADFFPALASGENLREGDALFALRRWCELKAIRAGAKGEPQWLYAAVTIKAFNAWGRGEEVSRLIYRPGQREAFPQIEGLPKSWPAWRSILGRGTESDD